MPHRRPRQVPRTAHRAVIPCRFAPMFLSLTEASHLKLIDNPQFITPDERQESFFFPFFSFFSNRFLVP